MRFAHPRKLARSPVSVLVRKLCLVAGALVALSACGSLEWPPSSGVPQLANRPPSQVQNQRRANGGTVLVRRGDSLYSLSQRHNVPLRGLIEANSLIPPYIVYPGQRLVLPAPRSHVVRRGDTLYGISRRYGVDVSSLARVNRLRPPYELLVGQRLQLPGQVTPISPVRTQTASRAPASAASRPSSGSRPRTSAPPPKAAGGFSWPVNGKILSSYGPKSGGLHNDGINIAAAKGAPVRAAQNGTVAYAGNELRGFGNLLLIRHSGGWITAYAHNDALLVRRGDRVRKGQMIARVGSSGNVASPQLHFEIRRGKQAVNPTDHLGTQVTAR